MAAHPSQRCSAPHSTRPHPSNAAWQRGRRQRGSLAGCTGLAALQLRSGRRLRNVPWRDWWDASDATPLSSSPTPTPVLLSSAVVASESCPRLQFASSTLGSELPSTQAPVLARGSSPRIRSAVDCGHRPRPEVEEPSKAVGRGTEGLKSRRRMQDLFADRDAWSAGAGFFPIYGRGKAVAGCGSGRCSV